MVFRVMINICAKNADSTIYSVIPNNGLLFQVAQRNVARPEMQYAGNDVGLIRLFRLYVIFWKQRVLHALPETVFCWIFVGCHIMKN